MAIYDRSAHKNLWILVNEEGRVIHKTMDKENVQFMCNQVIHARAVGDHWVLLHYELKDVVTCGEGSVQAI